MKNLNTIVPFYDAVAEQYRYRDDLLIEQKRLRLVCSTARVLPFIIRRDHNAGTTANLTFAIINANGGASVMNPASTTYLTIETGATYDYIKYTASSDFAAVIPLGTEVYVKIGDAAVTPTKYYYSDVFMVVPDVTDYILVEFWDDELLNSIPANFHQKIYIDNSFKTPDYLREDEGEKVDGIMLKQKSTVQKVLNLYNMITPEFLLDSLMTLPMIDNVNVTNLLADCIVPLEVRLKDPEWIADVGGSYAKLNIQFVEWVVIKKGGYKEMACTCGSSSTATINQGIDVLTAGVSASIIYDNPFTGLTYSLDIRAYDTNQNPVTFIVTSHTILSFAITALEDCTIEWIAVEV